MRALSNSRYPASRSLNSTLTTSVCVIDINNLYTRRRDFIPDTYRSHLVPTNRFSLYLYLWVGGSRRQPLYNNLQKALMIWSDCVRTHQAKAFQQRQVLRWMLAPRNFEAYELADAALAWRRMSCFALKDLPLGATKKQGLYPPNGQ